MSDNNCFNDDFSDEEFAEFKSANNEKNTVQYLPNTHNDNENTELTIAAYEQFKATFENDYFSEYNDFIQNQANNSSKMSSSIFDHASLQSQILWTNLQKINLKLFCLHNWKESLSFKRLLQALKIDNIVSILFVED